MIIIIKKLIKYAFFIFIILILNIKNNNAKKVNIVIY